MFNWKMDGLEDLSWKEKEACTELRKRVSKEITNEDLKNDVNLYLRFLRARDFNLDLAERMLRNHIAWRVANQIDLIRTFYEPEDVVIKYLPLERIGFDKEDSPVRYSDFGNTDFKGILKSCKISAAVKTFVWIFEEDVLLMKKKSKELGKNLQQWTYIVNFENYSLAKATHMATVETLIQVFQTYEANYPERLKKIYVINASVYFNILFSFIKPLLSGNTIRKIVIYEKDGWKEELLKAIDAEVLPAFLGGNKTDPDGNPKCYKTVKYGVNVPTQYYLTKSTHCLKDHPEVKKLVIARMSTMPIDIDVLEAGSVLEWEFQTETKDIGFALFYKKYASDNSKGVELIPSQKIVTSFQSESGKFLCEKAGVYILLFDNSYSWIYHKELYLKVNLTIPKEKKDGLAERKLV